MYHLCSLSDTSLILTKHLRDLQTCQVAPESIHQSFLVGSINIAVDIVSTISLARFHLHVALGTGPCSALFAHISSTPLSFPSFCLLIA